MSSMQTGKRFKKNLNEFLIYIALLVTLLLTAINLSIFFTSKSVLGLSTKLDVESGDDHFWNNFLQKHPDYIPGWIELGNFNTVYSLDPNYMSN